MITHNPVARAFELARDGTCNSIDDVRRKLEHEGYSNVASHLDSGTLKKQLLALIRAANPELTNHGGDGNGQLVQLAP